MYNSEKASISISRSVEDIYPWVAEPNKIRQWMKSIKNEYYPKNGFWETSKIKHCHKNNFKSIMSLYYKKRNEIVLGQIHSKNIVIKIRIELTDMIDKTQLTYWRTFISQSLLLDVYLYFQYKNRLKQQMNDLHNLKNIVESKTIGPYYSGLNFDSLIWENDKRTSYSVI